MSRVSPLVGVALFATLLFFTAPRPAAAQNVLNQTTCGGTTGVGSCLTNGFLQDLAVDCSAPGAPGQISTALALITDRDGPNRITVSGTCNVGVTIAGFNRLMIQGNGATLTRGWSILNSRAITLRSLTFNLASAPGQTVAINTSSVVFDGVTVENAQSANGVNIVGGSLGFIGPSVITGNGFAGINVGTASQVNLANVTVSNNGAQGQGEFERAGIVAHNGGNVTLSNQVAMNGQLVDAPVDISGNTRQGILMQSGTLSTSAESGNAVIHVHNNGDAGLELDVAFGEVDGHLKFDSNGNGQCTNIGDPCQITLFKSGLAIGEGAEVDGGLAAAFQSFLLLGDGGAGTFTGGVHVLYSSTGLLSSANVVDVLTCDGTSWMATDGQTMPGTNTCPSTGPAGITGPMGPPGADGAQGPQGIPGLPGVSGRQVVQSPFSSSVQKGTGLNVTGTCPAGKTAIGGGFSFNNLNFAVVSSSPDANAANLWHVDIQNVSTKTQAISGAVWVVCATTP